MDLNNTSICCITLTTRTETACAGIAYMQVILLSRLRRRSHGLRPTIMFMNGLSESSNQVDLLRPGYVLI